jgi:6-phosphogluconolactonase
VRTILRKLTDLFGGKHLRHKTLAGLSVALFLVAGFSISGMVNASPQSAVYTEDNASGTNHVLMYLAGPNGVLSGPTVFSAGGGGTGAALHSQGAVVLTQDGDWLLAVDAGTNQITVFEVGSGGSLSPLAPVSSQGATPESLAIYHDWVYVLDAGSGNIAGFVLGGSGALTFIAGSAQPLIGGASSSPEQVGFSPNGNTLYVTEKGTNTIDEYAVNDGGVAGAPTAMPSNGGGPYGFAFASDRYLILSEAGTSSLSSYSVSDSAGLRTISGAIPDFGGTPCWVAVSHDGRFAYAGNGGGGIISGYAISGDGTLGLFSSIAARTPGAAALDLAFGGSTHGYGQDLFALSTGHITSFQTYPDGGISQISDVGVPASSGGLAAT